MSSTIQRERAAARARLERQMAEKLEKARMRKKRSAIAGAAAAVLLVAGGVIWAVVVVAYSLYYSADALFGPAPL